MVVFGWLMLAPVASQERMPPLQSGEGQKCYADLCALMMMLLMMLMMMMLLWRLLWEQSAPMIDDELQRRMRMELMSPQLHLVLLVHLWKKQREGLRYHARTRSPGLSCRLHHHRHPCYLLCLKLHCPVNWAK